MFPKDFVTQAGWYRLKLCLNNKYILWFSAAINTAGSDTVLLASALPDKPFYSSLLGSLDSNSRTEIKTFSVALCEF